MKLVGIIKNNSLYNKIKAKLRKKQSMLLADIIKQLESVDLTQKSSKQSHIRRLLRCIKTSVILGDISMAEMPFIVYLLYYKYNGKLKLIHQEKDCIIRAGRLNIANMSYLAVYIHFLELKGNCLHIEGTVSQPTVFKDRCTFGINNNGEKMECTLYDRGMDLKKGNNTYETRTVYSVDIPLMDVNNRITFSNYIDGHECVYGKINSMRFSPVADCIKNQYCTRENWILYIEDNVLNCERVTETKLQKHEELFEKQLEALNSSKANWAISLRKEFFSRLKTKKKPVWLFMDRIDRAGDNAEALFRYVRNYKEIDSYFIIQKDTEDYHRLKELGNIVELNSKQHFLLVLSADYIISSQSNGVVENPFWDASEYFRDLYHQARIVFLQHGVIKDDMSSTLDRYNTNFYGFITSSSREKQSILDYPYYYSDEKVWLTGLPRFDMLYDNPQKYIVIMPSWRQGLMHQVWSEEKNNMIWVVKDDFLQSEYVQKYRSLMDNKELNKACSNYGYKLVFMPHALMEPYIDYFIQNDSCIYWDSKKAYRDAFAEGNLLITDYSSVVFDFAYLQKPILYYQFDKEKFFEEHTYKQGYYDYEKDGFGEVAYTEQTLVSLIVKYMEDDCHIKDKYRDRILQTFAYHDKNNCKRVYDRLMEGLG